MYILSLFVKVTVKKIEEEIMEKYLVILRKDDTSEGRYNVDKELFTQIKEQIKPYRSEPIKAKPVKCVETGQIFKCALEAQAWVFEQGLSKSMTCYASIKDVCKGLRTTMYGYHWEYVSE